MTKSELVNKISEKLEIPEGDRKLFFEMLLREVAEKLKEKDYLQVQGTGRFQNKVSLEQNDLISFVSNDNEELIFSIPEEEELHEVEPVDSHFSISIGKPVIPMKNSGGKEFFIPREGNDVRRYLEIKVENFIEEISDTVTEGEETNNIEDINFSFLNWKKTTDVNDEINLIEQELETFNNEIEEPSPEINSSADIEEEIQHEAFDNGEPVESEMNEINIEEEELIIDDMDEAGSIADEWDEKNINEPELIEEQISSDISLTNEQNEDDTAIKEAFKYADERDARIDSFKKRSYGGYIFAVVLILLSAGVIYLSFYFSGDENPPAAITNQQTTEEIPDQANKPNDEKILTPGEVSSEETKNTADGTTSSEPEILNARQQPSERIRGYIYQYNNGTFAAQVSSWKSKSIALSETKKYLDAGYKAFVEQTEMSGQTYYRVRIGGFNSLAEAEEFLKR